MSHKLLLFSNVSVDTTCVSMIIKKEKLLNSIMMIPFICVYSQIRPERCLQLHRNQIDEPVDRLLQERMTSAAFKSFDLLMTVRMLLNK